jgi:hypothetical protein
LRGEVETAAHLWFWTAGQGSWSCLQSGLTIDGDMAFADAERGQAMARLAVEADVPAAYHSALGVRAEPLLGGRPMRVGNARPPFAGVMPAGSYRVQWTCNGEPGPVIAAQLELVAGQTVQVQATAPVLQSWTGWFDSTRLGADARRGIVRVGGHWALGGADDGGSAPLLLPVAPHLRDLVEVHLPLLKLVVPARIASIDPEARTFTIEHALTAADIVRLQSRGLGSGARRICLGSAMPETRFPAWLGDVVDLPMLPGSEREGCLVECTEQGDQVTCWFTVFHGERQAWLQPRGHWAVVRLEAPVASVRISVEGWAGMDAVPVGQQTVPGERRIFVADGTRAVHVDPVPGRRVTFDPERREMVVR